MTPKNKGKYDPIVFVNKPVVNPADDVIGFEAQIDTINSAIDNGANMIGIIGGYGTGKSSLTDMLSYGKSDYKNIININMWACLHNEKLFLNSTVSEISNLTKSFLFQLASGSVHKSGVSKLARYVNKRLSKNYGVLSFNAKSNKIWWWVGSSAILYSLYLVLEKLDIQSLKDTIAFNNINNISFFDTITNIFIGANIFKFGAPLFLAISIMLIALGLYDACITFSHWKNQGSREQEINDVFDVYSDIIVDLCKRCNESDKQIVIIEDLDRIVSKPIILGFLR